MRGPRRAYEARLVPTTATVSIAGLVVCTDVTYVAGLAWLATSVSAKYPPTPPITASVSKPAPIFFIVSFITLSFFGAGRDRLAAG